MKHVRAHGGGIILNKNMIRQRRIYENPPLDEKGNLDKGKLKDLAMELRHERLIEMDMRLAKCMGMVVLDMIRLQILPECYKPIKGIDTDLT